MILLTGTLTEGGPDMDEPHGSWHPSKDEVAHILDEMRPIISQLARRDEDAMKAELWRRDHTTV